MRGVTFSEFKDGQNVDMFYNAPDCKPGTPMQEAIRTAKEIRQKYSKDIYVWCDYSVQHMYSQLTMQAFKMAGIEFVAAIPVLSNNLSKRENDCSIAYCEQRNIPYELFYIDVEELFNGPELEKYGEKFPTTQPQMTIVGKYFDILPKCCLVYPGFMAHISNSDWTRTKNNGFMPFVPHQTQEHAAEVSGLEYTNASGAADYLNMPRTTFLYFYNAAATLLAQFKPEYRVIRGKRVWYKEHLDNWNNKTANVQFEYKRKQKEKVSKLSKQSNITKFPNKSK